MSEHHWALLANLKENLHSLDELPPTIMDAIAERLEEAILGSSKSPLQALTEQLADFFDALLQLAPPETAAVMRHTAHNPALEGAYLLGQLDFAQLLAAGCNERRAGDEFLVSMNDRRYKDYIRTLFEHDCTGTELAEAVNERVETVSRKLQNLREMGLTDFRREGVRLVNFLTPTARAAYPMEVKVAEDVAAEAAAKVFDVSLTMAPSDVTKKFSVVTSDIWQKPPSFRTDSKPYLKAAA